jgi:AcrR family transcriptional regulator
MDTSDKHPSQTTRKRLIQAGVELFGLHGYDGTSTRMLAERANANIAAIPYHFGGKEGLYSAVVEHIGSVITANVAQPLEEAGRIVSAARPDRQEAFRVLIIIFGRFADLVVGSEAGSSFGPIITREQMHPTPAFDLLYERFLRNAHVRFTELTAIISGLDPTDPDSIILTQTLLGEVLVFRAAREMVLRRLEWSSIGPEELALIKRTVFTSIRTQLGAEDLVLPEEALS